MPEISRFFGIVIRMFVEVGVPHHRPHFHASYQEVAAVFAIDPVECMGGGCRERSYVSSRRGLRFTARSFSEIGISCSWAGPL